MKKWFLKFADWLERHQYNAPFYFLSVMVVGVLFDFLANGIYAIPDSLPGHDGFLVVYGYVMCLFYYGAFHLMARISFPLADKIVDKILHNKKAPR